MLYSFNKKDQLKPLPPLKNLTIREEDSPLLMSILGEIHLTEATTRFAEDNKGYVAYINDIPAGFGWMAMGKALIGELNQEFVLPLRHRYLWNFRTLPNFRGLGIYPRLLQHIIKTEQKTTENFWIMHAPENGASAKGIEKAGFKFVSAVSVENETKVAIQRRRGSEKIDLVEDIFNFKISEKEPASCWNCSSPYIKNRKRECCCTRNGKTCNSINRKQLGIKSQI